jgi:hypothetical protein
MIRQARMLNILARIFPETGNKKTKKDAVNRIPPLEVKRSLKKAVFMCVVMIFFALSC